MTMTEAEILHRRKMQLKNDIVKPLVTLIDEGVDVPMLLQSFTISKSPDLFKQSIANDSSK